MKIITKEFLKQEPEVCSQDINIFSKEWPQGMKVNKKNIHKWFKLGLNMDWFISHKLSFSAYSEYLKTEGKAYDKYFSKIYKRESYIKDTDAIERAYKEYVKTVYPHATKIILEFNPQGWDP